MTGPGRNGGGGDPAPAPETLASRLRLVVVTDRGAAAPREVEDVVADALAAGAPAVQLREKEGGAAEMLETARRLRTLTREAGALLFVNDRLDVALAAGADGVHLGPNDLPLASARRAAPGGFLIGYSADDPGEARTAVLAGADYIGCGAVYPTGSKDVGDEAIGPEGVERVVRAVEVPVVGIGGVTPERAPGIVRAGAAGVAVISAVMGAEDPGSAVRSLLESLGGSPEDPVSDRRREAER